MTDEPKEVSFMDFIPGEHGVYLEPKAAEILRQWIRRPYLSGYRAGVEAAVKALEDHLAENEQCAYPDPYVEAQFEEAVKIVKALLEEKP